MASLLSLKIHPGEKGSYNNLSIETESYTIRLTLPFNSDWCTSEEDYYIKISYTPETSHEIQCLELTSNTFMVFACILLSLFDFFSALVSELFSL